jgi:hypothetical protein
VRSTGTRTPKSQISDLRFHCPSTIGKATEAALPSP